MNFWEKLLQKWCHFLCSDNWLSWLGWSIQSHQIYPLFLPDDLDQHIGNKESTRNTQVNLPTSIWIAHNLNSPKYHSILNIFSIIFLQISDREAIALGMRKMLDIATEPWGIKVDLANGIKSPESSPKLVSAISKTIWTFKQIYLHGRDSMTLEFIDLSQFSYTNVSLFMWIFQFWLECFLSQCWYKLLTILIRMNVKVERVEIKDARLPVQLQVPSYSLKKYSPK